MKAGYPLRTKGVPSSPSIPPASPLTQQTIADSVTTRANRNNTPARRFDPVKCMSELCDVDDGSSDF